MLSLQLADPAANNCETIIAVSKYETVVCVMLIVAVKQASVPAKMTVNDTLQLSTAVEQASAFPHR